MCTVTFVRTNHKIIITSNRDEKIIRPSAIEPQEYIVNNKSVFYPKDPKAGGTWFAVSKEGAVLVLLNGAQEKHEPKSSYARSRGLILLDLIGSKSIQKYWSDVNLINIEPFTLVLYENEKLYQLRWDGVLKDSENLNPNQHYIWSSSTLYSKDIRENRAFWFKEFLNENPEITETKMMNFHKYTKNENSENGLIINRNDEMQTLSITQTVIENDKTTLSYSDLVFKKEFSTTFMVI